LQIKFKKFNKDLPLILPEYKTAGAAGMDLFSSSEEEISILPMQRKLIPTNLILEIPEGYEGQIRPRSGLALNNGLTVLNSPGTIDSDYRGEIKVLLINLGTEKFNVNYGDRIAQLIIASHVKADIIQAEALSITERDSGGYGSTGVKSGK